MVNPTDPDSRLMRSYGHSVRGYNAQIVATGEQIIIAAEVTQDASDVEQLAGYQRRPKFDPLSPGIAMASFSSLADTARGTLNRFAPERRARSLLDVARGARTGNPP